MKIKLAELKLDPRNARKHNRTNIEAIKASLVRFGQQKPVLRGADGHIVAGNGTVVAAKELGWDEIEVRDSDLAGDEATAYGIADNRTAELALWDDSTLTELLTELPDLLGTGFDQSDLDKMLSDRPIPPEVEFTEELSEEHNYLVLYFDNSVDWLNLLSLFPLKTVKALHSKPGFEAKGLGRVVKGSDFLAAIRR